MSESESDFQDDGAAPHRNVGGRPTKYEPEFAQKALKLCEAGATVREVAEFFSVSERTVHNWSHEHVEFFQALKLGRETADIRVEQSLYRRAMGYSHDSVHISNYQGVVTQTPIVEHYPPDTTAAIFWLKNRKPEEWRDRQQHEHSGPNGAPIDVKTKLDLSALTDEQCRALASIPVQRG